MTDVQAPACIFCGGETNIWEEESWVVVECKDGDCEAMGPKRPTRAEAVAAFLKPFADARREALEEAADLCEREADEMNDAMQCAIYLRALMPAPDPTAPGAVTEVSDD